MRARLVAAGLADVRVDTSCPGTGRTLHGPRRLWDWMLYSNPITDMILEEVDEAGRAKIRESLGQADPRPRGRRGRRRTHRTAQHRLGPEGRRQVTGSILSSEAGSRGALSRGSWQTRAGLHGPRAARVRRPRDGCQSARQRRARAGRAGRARCGAGPRHPGAPTGIPQRQGAAAFRRGRRSVLARGRATRLPAPR